MKKCTRCETIMVCVKETRFIEIWVCQNCFLKLTFVKPPVRMRGEYGNDKDVRCG